MFDHEVITVEGKASAPLRKSCRRIARNYMRVQLHDLSARAHCVEERWRTSMQDWSGLVGNIRCVTRADFCRQSPPRCLRWRHGRESEGKPHIIEIVEKGIFFDTLKPLLLRCGMQDTLSHEVHPGTFQPLSLGNAA